MNTDEVTNRNKCAAVNSVRLGETRPFIVQNPIYPYLSVVSLFTKTSKILHSTSNFAG
jgi:hypothetical protein